MQIEELQELDVDIDEIKYIIEKFHSGQNLLVVTGEFSSGKSSFINCYLNKPNFLPQGKIECTPVLIDIFEGVEDLIEIRTIAGQVNCEKNSKEVIYKYAKYDKNMQNDVLSISIPVYNSGLPRGTHIIDTPGTNTVLKEQEEITKYIVKKADAVLYVFNKVIAKTDIDHVINIMQYTKNIVFILTHIDEIDNKTGDKYSESRINELRDEAKKEIAKNTNISPDDMVMCVVGSMDGYNDCKYIDEIKSIVEVYVRTQTEEKRKRIAQSKIEAIIKSSIENYTLKREILIRDSQNEISDLKGKIKEYEYEQQKCEYKHENCIKDIDRRISQQEELCRSEFYKLLADERETISKLLNISEADEKVIKKKIEQINSSISLVMRNKIEETVNTISREAYDFANQSLKEMVSEFDVSVPLKLFAPDIKELDDSRLAAKLCGIEKEIEDNINALRRLGDNSKEQEKIEIEKQIRECESQKEEIRDRLVQLGAYKPVFTAIENEGGRNTGKVTGRVIGEIADLALLMWNPAGATAGAAKGAGEAMKVINIADKAKDTATIFRYIKNAAGKVAETSKKVNDKNEKAKKVVSVIKKFDDGRRAVIEKVQENAVEDGVESMSISTMLDMLSIGHWTEKLGGAIGDTIKPSTTTSIEDLNNKEMYENQRMEITVESNQLSTEIKMLKDELLELDDFGKQRRLESELKDKERALEVKKIELEAIIERYKRQNAEQQIKQYILQELEQYVNNQKERGDRLIQVIFSEAKMRLVERITGDYYEKMDSFQSFIKKLSNSAIDCETKISDCEKGMALLSQSVTEVGKWLD